MAPIIATNASSDAEDPNLNAHGFVVSKEKLGRLAADAHFLASEGRDDDNNGYAAVRPEEGEPLEEAYESNLGRRQSNLFADVNDYPSVYNLGNDDEVGGPPTFAFTPRLSLMQSSSESGSPSSLTSVGLEGEESAAHAFDDFAIGIMSQIDSDEALARQLQDAENEKKQQPKPKVKVMPSIADSLFGEPSPWEVKSQYTKVKRSSSSASDFPDSISGSISMFTNSFKQLGNGISAAATDFFGDDVGMQARSPFRGGSKSQYRNTV